MPFLTDSETPPSKFPVVAIVACASITILDGFDAFSLSLMAPRISAELAIPTAALGGVFASTMGAWLSAQSQVGRWPTEWAGFACCCSR